MKLKATGIFRNDTASNASSNFIEVPNSYLSKTADVPDVIELTIIHDDRQPASGKQRRRQRQVIEIPVHELESMLRFAKSSFSSQALTGDTHEK